MLSEYEIIIIGQQPWDTEIGSNCKNIALEFSKTNRVLYVNSPLDRISLYREKDDPRIERRLRVIKNQEPGLTKINENLWNLTPNCIVESINWISIGAVFNFINRLNNRRFGKSIQIAIAELGFKNFLLFNDSEMFKGFYIGSILKPKLSVYYVRDYMVAVPYWKKHGLKLEPKLIEYNDLCFANSVYLTDYCKQFNNASYYVGQGCELESFNNISDQFEPHSYKETVIGYVGALNSERLDLEIIALIAKTYTSYKILLIGPEDETFKNSSLHEMPNVIFLGSKPVDELPSHIQSFDICINPQLLNALTIGNYPRKIDEYLAVGKPVIATATKTMEVFKDYVYLANSKEEYITLISKALNEDSNDLKLKRKAFASTHTWLNSVGIMRSKIHEHLTNLTT